MDEPLLRGVCPIVDTPFEPDGSVDYDSLRRLVDTLATGGCHALAVFGYASEFYTLTDAERERIATIVVGGCGEHDVPSVLSVTAHATRVATQRARAYEALGADAIMVLPPHVRDPPVSAVRDHLAAVGEAVSIPVMVQYAPGQTHTTIPAEVLADLHGSVESIRYFKIECTPPGPYIDTLQELTEGETTIFVGRAGYELIEALDRGCAGVMPASSMFDVYLEIYEHYRAGRRGAAIERHTELLGVLNQLTKIGLPFEKALLKRRGLADSAHCRAPEADPDGLNLELLEAYVDRYVGPISGP